jgi:hypothetical protein
MTLEELRELYDKVYYGANINPSDFETCEDYDDFVEGAINLDNYIQQRASNPEVDAMCRDRSADYTLSEKDLEHVSSFLEFGETETPQSYNIESFEAMLDVCTHGNDEELQALDKLSIQEKHRILDYLRYRGKLLELDSYKSDILSAPRCGLCGKAYRALETPFHEPDGHHGYYETTRRIGWKRNCKCSPFRR